MSETIHTYSANDTTQVYKKWWFWVFLILVVAGITQRDTISNLFSSKADPNTPTTVVQQEKSLPKDYKTALAKAKLYSDTQHLSKQGTYDKLVSESGGHFTADIAQYAVDNLKPDWNSNALAKAKAYQQSGTTAPDAIRAQLVSPTGDKFTEAEADYAVSHL